MSNYLIHICGNGKDVPPNYIDNVKKLNNLDIETKFELSTSIENILTREDNKYNIIIVIDCDLLYIFRNIRIYKSKLIKNGKLYINNITNSFKDFLTNCITSQNNHDDVVNILLENIKNFNSERYAKIIKDILDYLLKNEGITTNIELFKNTYILSLVRDNEQHKIITTGLHNIGGYSCFIDSVLLAVLVPIYPYFKGFLGSIEVTTTDDKYCTNNFYRKYTDIQNELLLLRHNLEENKESNTCGKLELLLKDCNDITKQLFSKNQQDDSVFLSVILNVFKIEPTTIEEQTFVSNDSLIWVPTKNVISKVGIMEIPLILNNDTDNILNLYQRETITDYINDKESIWPVVSKNNTIQKYRYMKNKINILNSDLLIFHINRIQFENNRLVKSRKEVIFTEYVKNNEKVYSLSAITIHTGNATGGHYTLYMKQEEEWYYYDDLSGNIKNVDFKIVNTNAKTNGSLFFYL